MQPLKGKTVLITGATDGLGKEVAHRAAAAGATLLLHGRSREKGNNVVQEIKSATGNEDIVYYNADFSSLQEVAYFSEEVLKNHEALHVLINNAAIGGGPKGSSRRELSKEEYELRFAVNHLSHFLLTQNLLPLLQQSAPSRIVHVSSVGQSPLYFDDINLGKRYDSFDAYCKSKLAQILYGFELAEKLEGTGVTVNSLHPASLMNTNMVHDFFERVSSSVEEGADVVMYVAFSDQTVGVTGAYFNQFKQAKANAQAYEQGARKKLWQLSENLTKAFRK
ncbi:MAG TPA: SDR family NAD(P)-dependent oxidoreductase [Flavisolibacter sp.]|jgi:NAD(P)-dependent dehydrogenase (short-subunit alcohol dehydrogenase family)|nr:SDR family NAD(P)-dependent oxidoreductase [Flavisolibacter sp.]